MKDLVPAEDKEKKFGGKKILVSGDFQQLLPILEKASRAKFVNHTLKNSVTLWDEKVIILQLRQNMRVRKEMDKFPHDIALHEELKHHEQFLLDLGEGKLPAHATVKGYNLIEIPPSMCQPLKDGVIEKVFDDFQSHIGDPEYFQGRILLATTNKIVDEVNDEMVERIPGDLHTFHRIDTVTDVDNCTMFPMEFFRFCMQHITFAKNHPISLFGKCLFSLNFRISSTKPGFFQKNNSNSHTSFLVLCHNHFCRTQMIFARNKFQQKAK